MHNTIQIQSDLHWVGCSDRRLALFENIYPIPRGVSYNSYLFTDEKTVLLDTVDRAVGGLFLENIEFLLGGRPLDYLIVNHMEPDHCATMEELRLRYPDMKIICNEKTLEMIRQFYHFDTEHNVILVREGNTFSSGRHNFTFLMAPMVHWPEVMVTYDTTDKILFSADAFGTFGAISGQLFADKLDFSGEWAADARRYYTNIVGKYGTQVQALLQKAASVEINMICPLHGPVWRCRTDWLIDKYLKWSTYTPEENAVMIAYASIYGNTENAVNILAKYLAERGVSKIAVYDVSSTHPSVILAEAFRCSHLVFASSTYNAGIFGSMETVLLDLKAHNLQNRTVAVMDNGSWAPAAGSLMRDFLSNMKNMTVLEETVQIRSSLKKDQLSQLAELADAIAATMPESREQRHFTGKIDNDAMFRLSYGLFVLTARQGEKDNGCIINTVTQVTDAPKRISVVVNKQNFTHDMIAATGRFNISVLTIDAPFRLFQQFGFRSGRETDKFDGQIVRSENGIAYLSKHTNSYISAEVISTEDCGTHTLFVADVTEARMLSDVPSVTYDYYFKNIKPGPNPIEKKKGFVCKICGYIYEGDTLPPDYICPLCKHGAEDFAPIGE